MRHPRNPYPKGQRSISTSWTLRLLAYIHVLMNAPQAFRLQLSGVSVVSHQGCGSSICPAHGHDLIAGAAGCNCTSRVIGDLLIEMEYRQTGLGAVGTLRCKVLSTVLFDQKTKSCSINLFQKRKLDILRDDIFRSCRSLQRSNAIPIAGAASQQ